eukprot:362932-Chlamydomonas_euryale.AAC.2
MKQQHRRVFLSPPACPPLLHLPSPALPLPPSSPSIEVKISWAAHVAEVTERAEYGHTTTGGAGGSPSPAPPTYTCRLGVHNGNSTPSAVVIGYTYDDRVAPHQPKGVLYANRAGISTSLFRMNTGESCIPIGQEMQYPCSASTQGMLIPM